MKKIKVNSYRQYKAIRTVVNTIVTAFLIIFIIAFFLIVFKLTKNADYAKFAYAFFAANAIITNILFALSRSPIFMTRYTDKEQKIIYRSATMFLCAAVISIFICGYVYVNTNSDFLKDSFIATDIANQVISISFMIGTGFAVLFSSLGFFFFYLWLRKAMDKIIEDLK